MTTIPTPTVQPTAPAIVPVVPPLLSEADQAREWWKLHNRACRRELKRRGFKPEDPSHLEECRCNWPFVRYDQAVEAVSS